VGIFFGTFNPFHKTHLKILKEFIEKRQLEKVYIHSTVILKLHTNSLEGEIVIGYRETNNRRVRTLWWRDAY